MTVSANLTPAPTIRGTLILLASLTYPLFLVAPVTPDQVAHDYAVSVGLGILGSLIFDYAGNLRNLVRADLMGIVSLYFLTLFEFIFPQPEFNDLVALDEIQPALAACLMGFAGLAIGRHMAPPAPRGLQRTLQTDFSARSFLTIYTISLIAGYFYMLLAMNFNFLDMVDGFMWPRFSQPWWRGKFGGWKALLSEIGMSTLR